MKRISVLAVGIAIFAVVTFTYAQCTSDGHDVKVMCVKGGEMGGACCGMDEGSCCGGMEQAFMIHCGMGGCDEHFYLCCAAEMGLSEAQMKRLKEIRFEQQKSTIRLGADLKIMELELKELLQKTDPDRMVVGQKVTEMGELKTKMKKEHILARLDARSVLTKEQLEKCMGGHCGCCGKGAKKIYEQKSGIKEGTCSGTCSKEGKKCSGQGK